jgi:LytS/YehU family sensor histidine kinase
MTTRTLAEEIRFVKDYLAIQEFRFKERYQTNFSVDEKVDLKLLVPKMVLHTYVENAVKHAFKNIYSGGILEIKVDVLPNGVLFTVRDNGNEEEFTIGTSENPGKGIKIMESYYRLFEKHHNCKIYSSFANLNNNNSGNPGTEVNVSIKYF